MILQAWLTLPSCLASSSRPTLLRMTFWSFVIVGSPLAPPPGRGDIAPPRRLSAHRYHLIRQIKSRLLHLIVSRRNEGIAIPETSAIARSSMLPSRWGATRRSNSDLPREFRIASVASSRALILALL